MSDNTKESPFRPATCWHCGETDIPVTREEFRAGESLNLLGSPGFRLEKKCPSCPARIWYHRDGAPPVYLPNLVEQFHTERRTIWLHDFSPEEMAALGKDWFARERAKEREEAIARGDTVYTLEDALTLVSGHAVLLDRAARALEWAQDQEAEEEDHQMARVRDEARRAAEALWVLESETSLRNSTPEFDRAWHGSTPLYRALWNLPALVLAAESAQGGASFPYGSHASVVADLAARIVEDLNGWVKLTTESRGEEEHAA